MMLFRLMIAAAVVTAPGWIASAQTTFRQGSCDAAVPPFGGYQPGAGMTITRGAQVGATIRQGSAALAVPPFGGYQPGTGMTVQRSAPTAQAAAKAAAINAAARMMSASPAARGGAMAGGAMPAGNAMRAMGPAMMNNQAANPTADATAAKRAAADQVRQARNNEVVQRLLRQAENAADGGNSQKAQMYCRMARKRADGQMKDRVEQLLQRLQQDAAK